MVVVGASLWLDLFNKRDRHRLELAESFFTRVEGLTIYEPTLFRIELAGLLARYNPKGVVEKLVKEIVSRAHLCGDLDEEAYRVALATGCRAADAYYVACASRTSSVLFSNDRMQVLNARRYGIEAYYVLEEYKEAFSRVEELRRALHRGSRSNSTSNNARTEHG